MTCEGLLLQPTQRGTLTWLGVTRGWRKSGSGTEELGWLGCAQRWSPRLDLQHSEERQPLSAAQQSQAADIQEEEAALTCFYTHSSVVHKHLYLHSLSAFTLGPEKGFAQQSLAWMGKALPVSRVWGIGPWHGLARVDNTHSFRAFSTPHSL